MTNIFPTNYTLKATPVDADLLFIADSADWNNSKKITVGSMTSAIADWVINDSASASTTTYSSTKIIALNDAQDTTISGLSSSKLDKNGQLRTGNWAWKVTYNNGSGNETEVSLGSSGQVLVSNGATSAPTFQSVTADVNGQTEDTVGDMDADFVLAYDTSAGANRKQKISIFRASSGDVSTGTSTTKFVTPAQLANPTNLLNNVSNTVLTNALTYFTSEMNPNNFTLDSTTTVTGANGVTITKNSACSMVGLLVGKASALTQLQWGDSIDLKAQYCQSNNVISSSTTVYFFHGFWPTTAAGSGDITNTSRRVGFCHYNGRIYAITADNTAVTTTNIQADTSTTKRLYGIDFTPTSCKFYINGTLVATHTTNIPSGANNMNFWASGNDTGAGATGVYMSKITISETLS